MKSKSVTYVITSRVSVDLEQERRRIEAVNKGDCPYTKSETRKLLKLLDIVESGDYAKIVDFYNKLSRDEKEYVGTEIVSLLWEIYGNKNIESVNMIKVVG